MRSVKVADMACKCGCGQTKAGSSFLEKLNLALRLYGLDVTLNSGFRCPKHNEEEGGAKNSAHLRGLAVDLEVPSSQDRFRLVESMIEAGFRRIGMGGNFIHVDMDPSLPQGVMWLY